MRIIINAEIITSAPLSLKMPSDSDFFDGFPVMPVGLDADGKPILTGYLPASTVRGTLRRLVVTQRMAEAAAAGQHYDLPRVYSELIGQDARSEEKGDAAVDLDAIAKERAAKPVEDLFGAGMSLKSRLWVSHFMPEVPTLPLTISGVRKDIDTNDDALDALSGERIAELGQRIELNRERVAAEALVEKLKAQLAKADKKPDADAKPAEIKAALKVAKAALKEAQDRMGDMKNSSKMLFSHRALPPGLKLTGRLVVDRARDRDLDMLRLAFDRLSQTPILGAHRARGAGEIRAKFTVMIDGQFLEEHVAGGFMPARVVRPAVAVAA